jgi:hypothetical protein
VNQWVEEREEMKREVGGGSLPFLAICQLLKERYTKERGQAKATK